MGPNKIPMPSRATPHSDAAVSLGDLLRLRDVVAADVSLRDAGLTFEVHDGQAVAYLHSIRLVMLDGEQVTQAQLLVALNREVERRSRAFEGQLRSGDPATFRRLEELSAWALPGYNPKSTCMHLMALASEAGLRTTVMHDESDAMRECFRVRYAEADGTPTTLTTTVWMTGRAVTAVGNVPMACGFASAWPESQSRDFAAGLALLRSEPAALRPGRDREMTPFSRSVNG